MPQVEFSAIIVAAGSGMRLGAGVRKSHVDLGGRPLYLHCVEAASRAAGLREIILVVHPDDVERVRDGGVRDIANVQVVPGGDARFDSVKSGLARVTPDSAVVAIHDAARPFVTPELFEDTVGAADRYGAAVPGLPVTDTVKRVDGSNRSGRTVPRDGLVAVQTPQAFRKELLERALAAWDPEGGAPTDESQVVERSGADVHLVPGLDGNRKITTAADLDWARARVAQQEEGGGLRSGFGWDVHRLEEGGPLRLGGIDIPFHRGLAGHSDADVLLHALCDALLGASGLGDIGELFPDTDPRYRGADSRRLTTDVVGRVDSCGLRVDRVDLTVVAEEPKLTPYKAAVRASIAGLLGIAEDRVSLKAKTAEGLGPVGEGRSVEAYALVTLRE